MNNKTPKAELDYRIKAFRKTMDTEHPEWGFAVIFSKINMYYFTGTMQEGMLIIPRDGEAILWVRKSYERALDESLFDNIKPINSYRDAAVAYPQLPKSVYIETEFVPLAMYQRFIKHFPFEAAKSLDSQIAKVRSVKSSYELDLIKKSGAIHKKVLEDIVPGILKEGMSEAQLCTQLFSILIEEGHHGVSRFSMLDTDMLLGQIGYGVSSIYPSFFNGPGGHYGLSPAVPILGSRERKLQNGDLVFVDLGCGYEGYHTDKTSTYMFGQTLPEHVIDIHKRCVDIQNKIAQMLIPGAIPAQIYTKIISELNDDFLENFMGFGNRRVKFLGHGIGLHVDELPVIAEGFNEPLKEGMVFAIEPKKGIEGIGMVGIENTFIVTANGGVCITGDNPGLIEVH